MDELIVCKDHPERPAVFRESVVWMDSGGERRISSHRVVPMCDACRVYWDTFDAAMRRGASAGAAFSAACHASERAEARRIAAAKAPAVQATLFSA